MTKRTTRRIFAGPAIFGAWAGDLALGWGMRPRIAVPCRYLAFVAAANLVWETVQLPLYTIWREGSPYDLAVAVVHCTGGDVLIATVSLTLAWALVGGRAWPARRYGLVAAVAIVLGVVYTVFSERYNVGVRATWDYSDLMPMVPFLGVGLSPVAQWIAIPIAGFLWAGRAIAGVESKSRRDT